MRIENVNSGEQLLSCYQTQRPAWLPTVVRFLCKRRPASGWLWGGGEVGDRSPEID
jgi:hypothetical protein